MQGTRAAVFPGRLEHLGTLSLKQLYLLQPFRGDPSQIDLGILGIVDGDAVQEDGGMGTAQAADVDGLESARAAVVADLQAAEFADGGREACRAAKPGTGDGRRGRGDLERRRDPCGTKGIRLLGLRPRSGQKDCQYETTGPQ